MPSLLDVVIINSILTISNFLQMKENKNAKANLMAIAKKDTILEPISFVELSEVFGGGSDKSLCKGMFGNPLHDIYG